MQVSFLLITNLFFFGFTLWLSAYLLARVSSKMTVRLTGLGLLFFALLMGLEIVWGAVPESLLLIPALLWIGAALYLVPEDQPWRENAVRGWLFAVIPALILSVLNRWSAIVVILALLACAVGIARLAARSRYKNTLAVLTLIGLFFALSTGLVILPLDWLPRPWTLLLLGLDLLLLGVTITIWDAFEEGETIRSHLVRSFVSAVYAAGALAAVIFLAAAIDGTMTRGRVVALVGVTAFGVLTQTLSTPIQSLLDRLTAPHEEMLNDQRKTLRQTAEELPRRSVLDPVRVDEQELVRLTRRAISYLGDLPRLATSPLVQLPEVASISPDTPLDRAHALKAILVDCIQRLKPQGEGDYGTSEAWRYYNALYYPYVVGLKPYTRRAEQYPLYGVPHEVLDWFRNEVPERTLHNWQNTAARLIAEDLHSRH